MSSELTIALVGVGGYGTTYVPLLLENANAKGFRFVGGVDPYPERSSRLADLQAASVPVFPSMETLYANVTPDLVILSSPIGLHASQTIDALRRGSHVLCEKPIAAVPADAAAMKAARDAAGRHVAIGYQWSYCRAVQALKADAMAGVFGRLKRMRTIVLWPRDEAYYGRNDWAGAVQTPRGEWVLDSPVNNACAHHLHHMLYVAGPAVGRSATPTRLTAELYRANPIQNFDTAALRLALPGDVEVLFYVTHAGQKAHHPTYRFEFENAVIESADAEDAHIIATFRDGRKKDYGTPAADARDAKLWSTLDAIHVGTPSVCGIEAATPHCQVVWACHQLFQRIKTFAAEELNVVGESPRRLTQVPDLDQALTACFEHGVLPSEMGVPWATPATSVDIEPV
ncbi:MAG TPA: Gfo/Idh/MocA family oxidoreductase [Tepidisphaeraceae bacterium]|jgi:predicted dehydrogenase